MNGRHEDSRRQSSNKTDQKPMTSNQNDELAADGLVDDGIFHQPVTTDDNTPTNQRPTQTTDATNTTQADIIGFYPKTSLRIPFKSNSKMEHKKRLRT